MKRFDCEGKCIIIASKILFGILNLINDGDIQIIFVRGRYTPPPYLYATPLGQCFLPRCFKLKIYLNSLPASQ